MEGQRNDVCLPVRVLPVCACTRLCCPLGGTPTSAPLNNGEGGARQTFARESLICACMDLICRLDFRMICLHIQ